MAVRPEVELGEYKGVEVTKADAEVTDADVEEELKKVQDQNSRTVSVEDRAVKDGDMTVIDFEGFIEKLLMVVRVRIILLQSVHIHSSIHLKSR